MPNELKEKFQEIDNLVYKNSEKVLNAFRKYQVSTSDFVGTTGYGYNDLGRDKIEQIYADIFKAESSLVRSQIISGTHALTITLFGLLRPGDTLLSITGTPYDTIHEVIGIKNNPSSLKSYGILYQEIPLLNDDFNYDKIKEVLSSKKIKMVALQRSRGYSLRSSIDFSKLKQVIAFIRNIDSKVIIMVDNCYTEFCEEHSPIEGGADIAVGSLIKNLGGTIAPNGGYVVGKEKYVNLVAERLTVPGQGKEVGPSLNMNYNFLKGLVFSPHIVGDALKTSCYLSYLLKERGINTYPLYNEKHSDIVLAIEFQKPELLIKFVQGIQKYSLIDSFVTPIPSPMPGYDDQIIMASGSFIQGSSIEMSCDGPLRAPYVAYFQGSTTFEYSKIAIDSIMKDLNTFN